MPTTASRASDDGVVSAEKSWWPTQPSRTEISRATPSAEPVSHQVERMVRIRVHS